MSNILDELYDYDLFHLTEIEDMDGSYKAALDRLVKAEAELKKAFPDSADILDEYDVKIKERYSSGSKSELMVASWPSKEWTPESILERGMVILHFIEKEFDFVFPNDKYRKEALGLGFMINEGDEDINKTIAITETADETITNQEFRAEDYEKLARNAGDELRRIFSEINDYCLSISENINRYTTKHYVGYSDGKSFADFHFNSGYCHLMLRTIEYSDSQNKIELLGDNYNWVKKAKVKIYPGDDLEYIKGLIKQSYDSLYDN